MLQNVLYLYFRSSFLQCQNLGTLEDIYVAYIDSDGDEVILLAYIFIILTY
jgi:hypothetical protein